MMRLAAPAIALCALLGCGGGACGGRPGQTDTSVPEAGRAQGDAPRASPRLDEPEVVDPYCGMHLHPSEAAASFEHRGTTYYFCLRDHRDAFAAAPERFLADGGSGDAARPAADAAARGAGRDGEADQGAR